MSSRQSTKKQKREWLKLMGSSVVFIPLAALQGCSRTEVPGGQENSSESKSSGDHDLKPESGHEAKLSDGATSATAQLPRVSESDPDSLSLGYRHDASQVDKAEFPQFQAGQLCSNCSVYAQNNSSQWSTCPIFPGKLVHADGWCALYAPIS